MAGRTTQSKSSNDLGPLGKPEKKDLRQWRENAPTVVPLDVYNELRNHRGLQVLGINAYSRALGIRPNSVADALPWLERNGFLVRMERGGGVVWEVQPVPSMNNMPLRFDFRGASSIRVARLAGLEAELNGDELAALYLRYQHEPRMAALVRYLRDVSGQARPTITMSGIAGRMLQRTHATITSWLGCLERDGIVEQDYNNERLVLQLVTFPGDADAVRVDTSTLRAWLREEARVPDVDEPKTTGGRSEADQLLAFFYEVSAARDKGRGSPPVKGVGTRARDGLVATNICRQYTLDELKPLLVYYVFDWTDDAVSKYGRTLLTFQKNLAIIREEFDDVRMAAPNYAANKLKEYGLPGWSKVKNLEGDVTAEKRARSDAVIKAYNEHLYGPEEEYDSDVVDAESAEEAA